MILLRKPSDARIRCFLDEQRPRTGDSVPAEPFVSFE